MKKKTQYFMIGVRVSEDIKERYEKADKQIKKAAREIIRQDLNDILPKGALDEKRH